MNNKIMKMLDNITNSNVPVVLCSDRVISLETSSSGLAGWTTLLSNATQEDYSNFISYIDELLNSTCVFVAPKLTLPGSTDALRISAPLINKSATADYTVKFGSNTFKSSAEIVYSTTESTILLNILLRT